MKSRPCLCRYVRAFVFVQHPARMAALGLAGLVAMFTPACKLDALLEETGPTKSTPSTLPTGKRQKDADRSVPSPKKKTNTNTKIPAYNSLEIHLAMGMPKRTGKGFADKNDDILLQKPQYALSYNASRNGANWVSWFLSASWFGDAPRHKGKFLSDDSLPEGVYRVRHDDYSGSGYDRGHMVRSEERTKSPEDNKTTFLMTNILPQYHDLNAGPWLRLEEYCQELAQKERKELYIAAGGIYQNQPETIGKGVAVPDSFYKVIAVLNPGEGAENIDGETRIIAVIMPNSKGIIGEGWGQYRVSVNDVEKKAGYDFLPAIPDNIEDLLESRVDSGPAGEGNGRGADQGE